MGKIPVGLCQCGCGQKTNIVPHAIKRQGLASGDPYKYIFNHHLRKFHKKYNVAGTDHPAYKGGRRIDSRGYVLIWRPRHPRASNGYVKEHILIAETALGKPMPKKSMVHHVNGKPGDNSRGNHVICQDQAYHLLLHKRMRALAHGEDLAQ